MFFLEGRPLQRSQFRNPGASLATLVVVSRCRLGCFFAPHTKASLGGSTRDREEGGRQVREGSICCHNATPRVPEHPRPLGSFQGIVLTFPGGRDRGRAQSEPPLRTASPEELQEEQFVRALRALTTERHAKFHCHSVGAPNKAQLRTQPTRQWSDCSSRSSKRTADDARRNCSNMHKKAKKARWPEENDGDVQIS